MATSNWETCMSATRGWPTRRANALDPQFQLQVEADNAVPYSRIAELMALAQHPGVGKLSFHHAGEILRRQGSAECGIARLIAEGWQVKTTCRMGGTSLIPNPSPACGGREQITAAE
jgi:hypothetical protein